MRLAGFVLLAPALFAQAPQADLTGIPDSSGIYYHAQSGWIAVPPNPLLPIQQGNVRQILGLPRLPAIAEIPGPHSAVQVPGPRPVFHMRGFSPNNAIYLVHEVPKLDYREIVMPMTHDFSNWAHFRHQDLVDINLTPAGNGIVSLSPRADLRAGEYGIVSLADPAMRGIRISFDFGVR